MQHLCEGRFMKGDKKKNKRKLEEKEKEQNSPPPKKQKQENKVETKIKKKKKKSSGVSSDQSKTPKITTNTTKPSNKESDNNFLNSGSASDKMKIDNEASATKKTKKEIQKEKESASSSTTSVQQIDPQAEEAQRSALNKLSRLFEGPEAGCGAVSLVNNKLLVTHNDLITLSSTGGESAAKNVKHLHKIIDYFAQAVKSGKLSKDKAAYAIFNEICLITISTNNEKINLTDAQLNSLIRQAWDNFEKWQSMTTKEERGLFKEPNSERSDRLHAQIGYARGIITDAYKDFTNLQKFLINNPDSELFAALKGEKHVVCSPVANGPNTKGVIRKDTISYDDYKIMHDNKPGYIVLSAGGKLNQKDNSVEHAELKIADYLLLTDVLKPNGKPIFIAISKKCCADCSPVMESIKNATKALSWSSATAHLGEFTSKWQEPGMLDTKSKTSSTLTLVDENKKTWVLEILSGETTFQIPKKDAKKKRDTEEISIHKKKKVREISNIEDFLSLNSDIKFGIHIDHNTAKLIQKQYKITLPDKKSEHKELSEQSRQSNAETKKVKYQQRDASKSSSSGDENIKNEKAEQALLNAIKLETDSEVKKLLVKAHKLKTRKQEAEQEEKKADNARSDSESIDDKSKTKIKTKTNATQMMNSGNKTTTSIQNQNKKSDKTPVKNKPEEDNITESDEKSKVKKSKKDIKDKKNKAETKEKKKDETKESKKSSSPKTEKKQYKSDSKNTSMPDAPSVESSDSTGNENLRRAEKRYVTKSALQNNQEIFSVAQKIRKQNNNSELFDKIEEKTQKIPQEDRNIAMSVQKSGSQGKVTLLSEEKHISSHSSNVNHIIDAIKSGEIKSDSVICLERKQTGKNYGMPDIILLAATIGHNAANPENKIVIPAEVIALPIYKDAQLYNVAKERNIKVIGVDSTVSVSSNDKDALSKARESGMVDATAKIVANGSNAILLVGSAHKEGLEASFKEKNISVSSTTAQKAYGKEIQGDFSREVFAEKGGAKGKSAERY